LLVSCGSFVNHCPWQAMTSRRAPSRRHR
jgi:predicted small metal-binding protein